MTPEEVNNRINRPESGLNSRFAHGTMLGLGHRRRRWMMTRYLAGVLTVIAVGTLLIAYGLLNPRLAAADGTSAAQTFDAVRVPTAGDGVTLLDNGFRSPVARAYPVANRAVAPPLLTRDDRGYVGHSSGGTCPQHSGRRTRAKTRLEEDRHDCGRVVDSRRRPWRDFGRPQRRADRCGTGRRRGNDL